MKKQLLLFVMTLLPMVASADAVEIDGIYYNLLPKGVSNIAEVTYNPNGYSGRVEIPETILFGEIEYRVTAIGESAFYDSEELFSITIPNSIEKIGNEAFSGCWNLSEVHINSIEAWFKIPFVNGDANNPLKWAHHLYMNGEEIKD